MNFMQKLGLFGHIFRMHNSRKIKELMFRKMKSANRKEDGHFRRPHMGWLDNITKWGKASLQELSQAAMNRKSWMSLVKMASDTYDR